MQTVTIDTTNVKLNKLEQFIKTEEPHLKRDLRRIIKDCKPDLKANPDLYRQHKDDTPSVDIRLCIDKPREFSERIRPPKDWSWIFRIGDASFDQYHSDYCAASCITRETRVEDLLVEMVSQVLEQEVGL